MKSTVDTLNINPDLTSVKPGQCSMCGAMKSSHPTGCPNYGIICKGCGNVGHGLLLCRKVMSLTKVGEPSSYSNFKGNRFRKDKDKKKRKMKSLLQMKMKKRQ